jgi:hypothetical protein
MASTASFRLRDWIVPPVVVPLLLILMILLCAMFR